MSWMDWATRSPAIRPSSSRASQCEVARVVLTGTAGHHDDVRARHVGQPGPGGEHQAAFLVPDGPGTASPHAHCRSLKAQFRMRVASAVLIALMEPGLCRVTPMTVWPYLVASNSRHCPAAPVYPGLIPIAPG